jgi:hypothetical protein
MGAVLMLLTIGRVGCVGASVSNEDYRSAGRAAAFPNAVFSMGTSLERCPLT